MELESKLLMLMEKYEYIKSKTEKEEIEKKEKEKKKEEEKEEKHNESKTAEDINLESIEVEIKKIKEQLWCIYNSGLTEINLIDDLTYNEKEGEIEIEKEIKTDYSSIIKEAKVFISYSLFNKAKDRLKSVENWHFKPEILELMIEIYIEENKNEKEKEKEA